MSALFRPDGGQQRPGGKSGQVDCGRNADGRYVCTERSVGSPPCTRWPSTTDSHYLGYVKYRPDPEGDRRLFGHRYRQNFSQDT